MNRLLLAIGFGFLSGCRAFSVSLSFSQGTSKTRLCSQKDTNTDCSRRSFFTLISAPIICGLSVLPSGPNAAHAVDEVFKPNPLTNSVLEKIRIWEQAEADDLKYGGELERGDAGNKGKVDAYPKLLGPILQMQTDLQKVDSLVHGSTEDWKEALKILKEPKFEKIAFKKTFNAFGDNIYYSDPDRANLYLGGGTTPKTEQSLAYLLRNEILTNVEDLQAELAYLLKEKGSDTDELYRLSTGATSAMSQYLDNVSPSMVKRAKELLAGGE